MVNKSWIIALLLLVTTELIIFMLELRGFVTQSWFHLIVTALFALILVITLSGENISDKNTARKKSHTKMLKSKSKLFSNYDPITSLPHRLMLEDYLEQLIKHSAARRSIALLFIDLDRFKLINDTAGHRAGDLLLNEVKNRIQAILPKQSLISRQGGDEFIATIPDISREEMTGLSADLLDILSKSYFLMNQEFMVTASIGVTMYPEDAADIESMIKNADTALSLAKEEGNTFQFYKPEMNLQMKQRLELEKGLRKALENGEFQLYYQPQIDLRSGQIIGAEALIRWMHPDKGLIPPAEFIPLAEETGWIVPIGDWVIRTACEQNKKWQDMGFAPIRVAVNVSARQFQHSDFANKLAATLRETELSAEYVELEMTESILQNAESVMELVYALKRQGVFLSIDDFGTGYSSLSYLKRFPMDALKIDQSFVYDMNCNEHDTAIIKAIIAMAKSLSLQVIAEGIETPDQEKFLRHQFCDAGQGYLFSRPLPAAEFGKLLKNNVRYKRKLLNLV